MLQSFIHAWKRFPQRVHVWWDIRTYVEYLMRAAGMLTESAIIGLRH